MSKARSVITESRGLVRRGMADGFEWAFEGEQNQVCETEQSSVNKDRHMKYAQSGRTSVKQGGTTGYDFYSCPGKKLQGQDFFYFHGRFYYDFID